MNGSVYVNPASAPPSPRRRSFLRAALAFLVCGIAVMGVLVWILKAPGAKVSPAHAEKATGPSWKAAQMYEPLKAQAPAAPVAKPETDDAKWRQQEATNKMLLELLKQRQAGTAQAKVSPPVPAPKPVRYAVPLFLDNKLEEKPAVSSVKEYTLAPGATKIPCVVETKIVSDVEGYFTCRVTTNVYDTATGHHLLVPQGSTILANDQASRLIYGNERMDTVSLKLTLPNGHTVDLGQSPITDQQGVAGLTGDVNQHYGRLLAAVLIQGALKGGAVAVTQVAGGDPVVSQVTNPAGQATNRITGPMLNTRPTITVEAGQLAAVLLLKPLQLPGFYEATAPRALR